MTKMRFVHLLLASAVLGACSDSESALGSTAGSAQNGTSGNAGQGGTVAATSGAAGSAGNAGSGGSGGTGGSDYTGPCTPVHLGDTTVYFDSISHVGVEAPVFPVVPGAHKTRLTLELYDDDGSGSLPTLSTGTFAFATPPDDNYGTCQHCLLMVGYDLGGTPTRAFYAKNGQMTVDKLDADDSSIVSGSVDESEMVEVVQNPDLTWVEKPGGACFYLSHWEFDTTPANGASCTSAEQCPNELYEICDPTTARCAPAQCSLTFDPPFCADGEVCLSQLSALEYDVAGPALGACYTTCDPTNLASCGDGKLCRPLGPTQTFGICLTTGASALGESCTPRDLSSECTSGAVCSGEPGVCAPICAFLKPTTGCPADTFCSIGNLCEPASHGDLASIGQPCAASSPAQVECGIEGDAFRGVCMNFFPQDPALECERLCRTADPACPAGQSCLSLFSNVEVGVCHPIAVCGDAVLDVIGGETCDDGNTTSGDGCSADCHTAELDELCPKAQPLTLGITVQGDTTGGPSGYASTCDPYVATPVRTFAYLPPGPGKLTLELSSVADLGISVLGDCADATSELRCQNVLGDDTMFVQIVASPTEPVLVVVRGGYPFAVGSFSLQASFHPAVCGDGDAQGPEACDDGNTTSGDGCAADCSVIEWNEVCASRAALTLDAPLTGTTETGSAVFDLAGVCSSVLGSGKERAYSFTAPATGTLDLMLTQPSDDFSLYVEEGCGAPDQQPYLACSNFASVGDLEKTQVELTAGQNVTVIVDGFRPTDAGEFSLTATFSAH